MEWLMVFLVGLIFRYAIGNLNQAFTNLLPTARIHHLGLFREEVSSCNDRLVYSTSR